MVKTYRIKGKFGEKGNKQGFTKDVRAMSREQAMEKAYTDIGSQQNVRRFLISVGSVEEIKSEESNSLAVRQLGEVD